jgi:hypothetical protein
MGKQRKYTYIINANFQQIIAAILSAKCHINMDPIFNHYTASTKTEESQRISLTV